MLRTASLVRLFMLIQALPIYMDCRQGLDIVDKVTGFYDNRIPLCLWKYGLLTCFIQTTI